MQPPRSAHRREHHDAGAARCPESHTGPLPLAVPTHAPSPTLKSGRAVAQAAEAQQLPAQGVWGCCSAPGVSVATHPLPSLKVAVRLCCVEEIIFQTQEKRCALFVGGASQGNPVERAVGHFLMGPRGELSTGSSPHAVPQGHPKGHVQPGTRA